MITEKNIEHLAGLARIKTTDKERESLKKDLSSILDYIEKLNEARTENIEPLHQITGLVNSVREDEDRKEFKMDKILNDKLVGQAPRKENGFIKVKSILSK